MQNSKSELYSLFKGNLNVKRKFTGFIFNVSDSFSFINFFLIYSKISVLK